MAFELMNDDLNIISKLGDIPGADDGLSAQELKALFDKSSLLIQSFINNKLIPEIKKQNVGLPIGGGTMEGPINMNGQNLSGLNSPTADDEPATKGYADNLKTDLTGYATETYVKNAVKEAAPYNYAHNSDFEHFVAQAGIGGNHGKQAYAGDRWILDSGTVTGEANEGGDGHHNITLNGTIRQIVANPPDVGTVAIEMVSGTAQISYENGEITITSNGGVIRNVRLVKGAYTADNMPNYQPRAYGVELAECQRYFIKISGSSNSVRGVGAVGSAKLITPTFYLPVTMRKTPTVQDFNIAIIRGNGNSLTSLTPSHIGGGGHANNQIVLSIEFSEGVLTNLINHVAMVYGNNLVLSCDL